MDFKRIARYVLPAALGAALARRMTTMRSRGRRVVRRAPRELDRRIRYLEGRLEGLRYRLAGRHPDATVPDDVLADRIRSSIGTLEKRLDMPHVHVMVEDHMALLHGDVPDEEAHEKIVEAVLDVSGVAGVVSYLHVGLLPSDSRPSEGRTVAAHSSALSALADAARDAGAGLPFHAVRAVLSNFMDRVPNQERRHVLGHLPEDVRTMAAAPVHAGHRVQDVRDLVSAVDATGALFDTAEPRRVVEAIVSTLRGLVPEEANDVAATLPADLRSLWDREPAR